MTDIDGSQKRLLIEFVLPLDTATPGTEIAVADLGLDIPGFTVDDAAVNTMVPVTDTRHGPMVMLRGVATGEASVGSDPRVVGVWLDQAPTGPSEGVGAAETVDPPRDTVAPEWSDPDVEGPERYLF